MDILSNIFNQSGLKKRIVSQRLSHSSASLEFPCDKSFGFHFVLSGTAYLHTKQAVRPILLNRGDIALTARGTTHIISTEEDLKKTTNKILPFLEQNELIQNLDAKKVKLSLLSGAYQFWNNPVHPFFKEFPDWYILRADEIESYEELQSSIKLMSKELLNPGFGSEVIVYNLLDIMFNLIIRRIVKILGTKNTSWCHAIQDLQIKKSIEMLHNQLGKDWTLDELAKTVGLSRAGFAKKFKQSLGDTPLHYLTIIRIQKSMELLSNTDDNIEAIALKVGYKDPFSFSKVFKKITKLPPKEFRINERKNNLSAGRF